MIRKNNTPVAVDHKPAAIIRRKKDFTNYDNTKHLSKSAVQRYNIIEEALIENFVGKKIGVYCRDSFITGICEKYISGILFLRKTHYKFMSDSVDCILEGDSDCIAIEKMGKSIVLL